MRGATIPSCGVVPRPGTRRPCIRPWWAGCRPARWRSRAEGTPVEAAAIRHANGTFWGVQYHPELGLGEIADALRRQSEELVRQGVVEDVAALEARAGSLEALDRAPGRRDLAARLGLDEEVLDPARRMRELRNFLDHVAGRAASTAA